MQDKEERFPIQVGITLLQLVLLVLCSDYWGYLEYSHQSYYSWSLDFADRVNGQPLEEIHHGSYCLASWVCWGMWGFVWMV